MLCKTSLNILSHFFLDYLSLSVSLSTRRGRSYNNYIIHNKQKYTPQFDFNLRVNVDWLFLNLMYVYSYLVYEQLIKETVNRFNIPWQSIKIILVTCHQMIFFLLKPFNDQILLAKVCQDSSTATCFSYRWWESGFWETQPLEVFHPFYCHYLSDVMWSFAWIDNVAIQLIFSHFWIFNYFYFNYFALFLVGVELMVYLWRRKENVLFVWLLSLLIYSNQNLLYLRNYTSL